MNNQRLQAIAQNQQYHILPIRSGMQLELHERVGDDKNQRIWKFKGLVLKVKRPNHVDGTFTIRGKTSGMTIEKIYPLSFQAFDKVLLLDTFKVRRAKLYYLRDKVGKDARLKSLITSDERGMDLLILAKEGITVQEEILGVEADMVTDTAVIAEASMASEDTVTNEVVEAPVVDEIVESTPVETTTEERGEEANESPVAEEMAIVTEEVHTETESSSEDDLIVIDGIGPAFKERLAGFDIRTFEDLAHLSDERIAEIEASDSMTSLEEWHNWIEQAKAKLA